MKTGATKQQIEDAALQYHDWIGGRRVKRCNECEISTRNWAAFLVPENHRIVSVQLLTAAWERITAQANLSDADTALANELKAAFEGDGE